MNYDRSKGKRFSVGHRVSGMGKTKIWIGCPHCGEEFYAYVWSMCGSGKKCPGCGALHVSSGMAFPAEKKRKRGVAWRRTFEGHHCGWPGCDNQVGGRLWACREHWLLLPVEIRDRLMASSAPGPGGTRRRGAAFAVAEAEALLWVEQNA